MYILCFRLSKVRILVRKIFRHYKRSKSLQSRWLIVVQIKVHKIPIILKNNLIWHALKRYFLISIGTGTGTKALIVVSIGVVRYLLLRKLLIVRIFKEILPKCTTLELIIPMSWWHLIRVLLFTYEFGLITLIMIVKLPLNILLILWLVL